MKISDFIKKFEVVVPKHIAWQKDNVGFQIGKIEDKITNILFCLDVNLEVVNEAIKTNSNFILSHHPLIFKEQKSITTNDRVGEIIHKLISNKLNLYSTHTNFDSIKNGVNFALAEKLKLKNLKFLSPLNNSLIKIIVFVPKDFVNKVADAMFSSGAGEFSNYKNCSFQTSGTGSFFPKENANPTIGKIGKLEKVSEMKLEMICEFWKLNQVIEAMKNSHPYEEIAFDIFKLENKSSEFGIGVIGEVEKKIEFKKFLSFVKKNLNVKFLKFSNPKSKTLKTVAVCGGSGSEYIQSAISQNADAIITADIKYHTFQEFENKILIVDAGHYETEIPSMKKLKEISNKILKETKIKSFISKINTNSINYF